METNKVNLAGKTFSLLNICLQLNLHALFVQIKSNQTGQASLLRSNIHRNKEHPFTTTDAFKEASFESSCLTLSNTRCHLAATDEVVGKKKFTIWQHNLL